jgi:hypothetical protein
VDANYHRVRVDSAKTVNFHQPKVTVLPRTGYAISHYQGLGKGHRRFYGELGFIDEQSMRDLLV